MGMNERRYKIARPTAKGWKIVEQDDRGRFVWISEETYTNRDAARAALRAMKTGGDDHNERVREREKRDAENARRRAKRKTIADARKLRSGEMKMKEASPEGIAHAMDVDAGIAPIDAPRVHVVDVPSGYPVSVVDGETKEVPDSVDDGAIASDDLDDDDAHIFVRPSPPDAPRIARAEEKRKRRAARHANVRHTVTSGRDA